MKLRSLVILAVTLAVLVGFTVWTSREPAKFVGSRTLSRYCFGRF